MNTSCHIAGKSIGALLVLLAFSSLPALAQTNKAEIVGTVTDSNGAVISNAIVTITNINTGAERRLTTNSQGTYNAALLEIGSYKVSATAPNFKTAVRGNVVLQTDDRLAVNFVLVPGEV